jgi:hypothetical protein
MVHLEKAQPTMNSKANVSRDYADAVLNPILLQLCGLKYDKKSVVGKYKSI